MIKYILIIIIAILVARNSTFANNTAISVNSLYISLDRKADIVTLPSSIPLQNKNVKIYPRQFLTRDKLQQIRQDTLSHHGDPYRAFTDQYYWAVRYTMPSLVVSLCSLKVINLAFYRVSNTNPAPCSIFVFRDTIIDGISRPGLRLLQNIIELPSWDIDNVNWIEFVIIPIAFKPGESFWTACMRPTIGDPYHLGDAYLNEDSTLNVFDETAPAGPPDDWNFVRYNYLQEAIITYKPLDNDVGVNWLNMPGYVITNIPQTITIKIKNYGAEPQTSIPVAYDAGDGSGIVTETWAGNLEPGEDTFYTFIQQWTPAVPDTTTLKVWTGLSGDQIIANDTLIWDIQIFPPCPTYHTPPYSKDFNEFWGPFGDIPPYCGWQIVDNGSESPKVWNTNDWAHYSISFSDFTRDMAGVKYDDENSPPENQDEWLLSSRFNCSTPGKYTVRYWHWYQGYTTSLDNGYVLVSNNGGLSWIEIAHYIGGQNIIVDSGYKTHDITSYVAESSNVKIAFRYHANDANFWFIDDFGIDFTSAVYLNVSFVGDGNVTQNPNREWYIPGTQVTLTAQASPGWEFIRWSGDVVGSDNPLQIEMDTDKNITATFEQRDWIRKADILSINADTLKAVYDGSALTNDGEYIYAFHGNKTKRFYKYAAGKAGWTELESLGFRNKTYGIPGARISLDKAYPAAGAALCYDGDNRIYAIKAGGKREMWAYIIEPVSKELPADTWVWVCTLPPRKGVKGGSGLVLLDGKLYLLVGGLTKTDSNNFFRYTPGGSWEILEKAPTTQPDPLLPQKVWKDGSTLTVHDGKIYALRGGAKNNYFYKYEHPTWTFVDSLPALDTLYYKVSTDKWTTAKKYLKLGASIASNGANRFYAIKSGKSSNLWTYSPGIGWATCVRDTIPHWNKKYPDKGSALSFLDGKLYLLKGNKTRQFWMYERYSEKSTNKNQLSKTNIQEEQTLNQVDYHLASHQGDRLLDVTPNPFTRQAVIRYNVSVSGKVMINLFDISGRLIETLVDENINAGTHQLKIDQTKMRLANGIYFLRYIDNANREQIKLIIH